mmetsp:Transcript_27052/g.57481  ORF Transcript_27052/g.57481 Transcript_27052/m.57481 type:complete len:284 (+) Transcript_27052:176-1027(+)
MLFAVLLIRLIVWLLLPATVRLVPLPHRLHHRKEVLVQVAHVVVVIVPHGVGERHLHSGVRTGGGAAQVDAPCQLRVLPHAVHTVLLVPLRAVALGGPAAETAPVPAPPLLFVGHSLAQVAHLQGVVADVGFVRGDGDGAAVQVAAPPLLRQFVVLASLALLVTPFHQVDIRLWHVLAFVAANPRSLPRLALPRGNRGLSAMGFHGRRPSVSNRGRHPGRSVGLLHFHVRRGNRILVVIFQNIAHLPIVGTVVFLHCQQGTIRLVGSEVFIPHREQRQCERKA